ncbi:hypothetical protein [Anaerosporobacter sp.]
MADGILKFDTKVDDTGYVQGVQKMSSKQIGLTNNIKKTQAEMNKLEKSMKDMQNTKVPTQEYLEIQKQISQAESQLNKYLDAEERLKSTGGANTKNQSWKSLQYNIQQTRNTLNAAKADMESLKASGGDFTVGADTTKLEKMKADYDILTGKLSMYEAKLLETQAAENATSARRIGTQASIAELQTLEVQQTKTSTSTGRLSALFAKLRMACSTAYGGLRRVGNVARTVGSAFLSITRGVVRATSSVMRGAKRMLSAMNPLNKLKGMFSGMMGRMILMSIGFMALTKALQAIGKGFSSIVRTSPQLSSSLAQIKGNLYTAFQPILEACLPALNALFSVLVKVTAALAQFISMLFGKSVKASQSAAKSQYDQAAALDKTAGSANKAKKALKGLADFDELHNSSSADDSSSGGGGGGAGDTAIKPDFTTGIEESGGVSEFVEALKKAWKESDFTEVGVIIGEKLNSAMESIDWSKVQATSNKIAKSIATFLNGAIYGLDWTLVGSTLGNGINTAIYFAQTFVDTFDFGALGSGLGRGIESAFRTIDWNALALTMGTGVNGIFETLNNAIKAIDFTNIGTTLAQSLNTLITTIDWIAIGTTLSNGLNGAINLLYGFVTTFDFSGLGTSIGSGINRFLTNTNWKKLGMDLSGLAVGLLDSLTSAIKAVDWESLGGDIVDLISGINWGKVITGIVDALVAAVNGAISLLFGIGEQIGKNIIEGLQNGISLSDIIKNALSWVKKHIVDPIVNNVKKLLGIHSPSTVFKEIGGFIIQGMINGIKSLIETVKTHFKNLVTSIKGFFTSLPEWFSGKFSSALTSVKNAFTLSSIKSHFSSICSGVKSSFSSIADWFKTTFTKAWTNVKNVFSKGGKIFDGIKDGILSSLKSVINGLINGINKVIATPFNGLNKALKKIKNVNILGAKPFDFISEISVPKIPQLANGTYVPANYGNFLAVLGDNKREPEVVSPVSKIEEAVENVLNRRGGGNGNTPIQVEVIIGGKSLMKEVISVNNENAKAGKISFQLA